VIILCLSTQIYLLSTSSQTLFLCQPKMNIWNCLRIRDMLSGEKILLSIGILGGARFSVCPKLMVNLVTLSSQRQRDQRSGNILSRVLIYRMVLPMLFARHVERYLPTLSFGLVVVVHLLFSAMPSIRNVVAQKLVKDYCCNLEREL
jgi:hypothetical protein